MALAAFADGDGDGDGDDDFAGADTGADAFDEAACSARRYQQWRLDGCSMR
jgi:hypothetical protein